MKILYVNTSDTNGGAARAAMRIMRGVQQSGQECRMLVKHKLSGNDSVVSLQQYVPNNPLHNVLDWCVQKLKNKYQHYLWRKYTNQDVSYKSDLRATRMYGALQAWDYDILHLHWINQRFLSLDDLTKLHKPIVWTLHDSWPFCGVCHYFLDCKRYQLQCGSCPQLCSQDNHDLSYQVWRKKKEIYEKLDLHIVSPSRWLADCARKSSLFSNCDIHVIPNCIDTNIFRPLSCAEIETNLVVVQTQNVAVSHILRTTGEKVEKPFILYGAVNAATDRIKGFSSLLSALQILDNQGFQAALVVFCAQETDLPLHFENIDVTFVGYISDTDTLVDLYNLADVMVVPSLTENLSCAIMESLSCGTPVCCFNIGGNGDMVEHQVNGYLAAENDCADMANGIRECIAHSVEWGKYARESVLRKYTIDIVAEQYIDLYQELLSTRCGEP